MNNALPNGELSEVERMEFLRRIDKAYAVIHSAVRLLYQKWEEEQQLEGVAKAAESYWYWVFFVLGIALSYLLPDRSGFSMNVGTWIVILSVGSWCAKQYSIWQLMLRRDRYSERLAQLELIWSSAMGYRYNTLDDIRGFADNDVFDLNSENFRDWWFRQQTLILENMCRWDEGPEKAEKWRMDLARRGHMNHRGQV